MKSPTDLNDYHRKQSARLAKKISAQPLLSPEESMKQIERLSGKSQQLKANAHQLRSELVYVISNQSTPVASYE